MDKKNKIFNNRILYIIPLLFFIIMTIRIIYSYNLTKQKEYEFAKKEAEVLNSYVLTHRDYYQSFFINKTITLNEKTLPLLPAYSASPISHTFSENNSLNITVKTVSDRARNPKNMVDIDELKAINYFKSNKNGIDYFSDKNKDFYQYGYPLKIEEKCLKCHGSRQNAPKFIQERYSTAYDYKLGDIRGIVSIKLPKNILNNYFMKDFIYSIIYDIGLLLSLFVFIFYLLRKSKKINELLEELVEEKTEELISKNNFLNSYVDALDSSSSLTKTDKNGIITYANDKFLEDTGFKLEEVLGKSHKIIRHPDTPKGLIKDMWNTVLSKKNWNGIVKGLKKDKTEFVTKMSIVPVTDENGKILEYICPRTDITELVNTKERIENSLITDTLTNFPNRQKLINEIKTNNTSRYSHLALLNIDRFKDINDFYGHSLADKALILVAQKLKNICSDKNSDIYKLPSDEYAIYSNMKITEEEFKKKVENIVQQVMETKFEIHNNTIFITFSCGLASNTNSIMVKADMALQIAKEAKKHFVVYDDSLDVAKNITQNIQGVSLLKDAIQNNNIVPHFQPIYNIHNKKIEKYECLARITQKNGFIIAPIKFLDIAVKSKLYPQITRNIVTKSFNFFEDKAYEFSINLSMDDILNPQTVEFILESLENYKNSSSVVFEILENQEIENYDELKEFIKEVKRYGCKIAIDDFGSGYSNFAHIYELNIDYLKIDASLVKYITTDDNSKKITQTIINFAKDMELKTIAEFVEDKKSLDMLEQMGADYIQGYYIGKPQEGLNDKF